MASFKEWNRRLVDFFFRPAVEVYDVLLQLDGEILDSYFDDLGGRQDFEHAMREGPLGFGDTLRSKALGLFKRWHVKGDLPTRRPPYFAYLALFCYAWTLEDPDHPVGPNQYFELLRRVIPDHGLTTLNWTGDLWVEVASWANLPHRMNGRFGNFHPGPINNNQKQRWVGIPKAQVLMTGTRRMRLPCLFESVGIKAGDSFQAGLLTAKLGSLEARWVLGHDLRGILLDEAHPLHGQVLELLEESFDSWDGDVPLRPGQAGGQQTAGQTSVRRRVGKLMLVLIPPTGPDKPWDTSATVRTDDFPPGRVEWQIGDQTWSCRIGSPQVHCFRSGPTLLPGSRLTTNPPANGKGLWTDDDSGLGEIDLRSSGLEIRLLEKIQGCLVETDAFPPIGPCWFLVKGDSPSFSKWEIWIRKLGNRVFLRQAEWIAGRLQANWQLWHISEIADLSPESISGFPGKLRSSRDWIFRMTLRGGTRIRGRGIRRGAMPTYLPFDLPDVALWDPEKVFTLSSDESTLIENGSPVISDLTGPEARTFRVIPHAPSRARQRSRFITIKASRQGGESEGQISFVVDWQKEGVASVVTGSFAVDRLGLELAGDGLAGAGFPKGEPQVPEYANPSSLNWLNPFPGGVSGPLAIVHLELGLRALDFLAVTAANDRVSYTRVRDAIAQYCEDKGFLNTNPQHEIKAMAQLGHIDIGRDSNGRWAWVYPTRPHIYQLPGLRDGLPQWVLTGCYTTNDFKRFSQECCDRSLEIHVTEQLGGGDYRRHRFVPPQVMIQSDDHEMVSNMAKASGIQFSSSPSGWVIANWAEGLKSWLTSLGDGLRDRLFEWTHAYNPRTFRTVPVADFRGVVPGNFTLVSAPDQSTNGNLPRYQGRQQVEGSQRFFRVTSREWATWMAHSSAWNGEPVPVAYRPDEEGHLGTVMLPQELDLPPVLSRALVLCSGYAPSYEIKHNPYAIGNLRLEGTLAYRGKFVSYDQVPEEIAAKVLGLVGARPEHC
jgi:hypothetical protein